MCRKLRCPIEDLLCYEKLPIQFLQTGNALKNWLQHHFRSIILHDQICIKINGDFFLEINDITYQTLQRYETILLGIFSTCRFFGLLHANNNNSILNFRRIFRQCVVDERIQNDRPYSCEPWPTRMATVELFGKKLKPTNTNKNLTMTFSKCCDGFKSDFKIS